MAVSPAPPRGRAHHAHVPLPPREHGGWIVALALALIGALALGGALGGVFSSAGASRAGATAPPIPLPGPLVPSGALSAQRAPAAAGAIVGQPSAVQQSADQSRFEVTQNAWVAARWMEGFYPVYAVAQETFAVNWLLLASIHMQETAVSTAAGTYHGLNFAHCCGGPMQFNVTNGPPSTWQLVNDSYIYGRRPASYHHMTRAHPSIYDDFDAIMAGAHLLSADGAEFRLDGAAWNAAYDYYGHDLTGVTYADQVLARAIGWSEHGFCVTCETSQALVDSVHAAYGAPVAAQLLAEASALARAHRKHAPSSTRRHAAARG
ncbi:MAG TPA: hypothetical protein VGX51_11935 [Solirubrobacteraceae bacterium]|nr:hypothetical protein [Solirubrobacteraceae bacterium]